MKRYLSVLFFCALSLFAFSKEYTLSSPDGKLMTTISAGSEGLFYTLSVNGNQVINKSEISMILNNGQIQCGPATDYKVSKKNCDTAVKAFAYKCSEFQDKYNSLILSSRLFAVEFRLFNQGLAYRFKTSIEGEITVDAETAEFTTSKDFEAYLPLYGLYGNFPDNSPQECLYVHKRLSEAGETAIMTPMLIDIENGQKLLITESDLRSYPGLNLKYMDGLKAVFSKYPSELYYKGGVRHAKGRENYIAKTDGTRSFPWRIIAFSEKDSDLPNNNMVYSLAHENIIGDYKWIHPGKSAWEWWSNNTLYGVDFKAGINTETYKYYIDFAKKYNLDYIILDGGWSTAPLKPVPEVNIEEIASYGKEKGIGVIVWAFANQVYDDMENICKYYSEIGVSGFKIDFIDRDDQLAVEMVEQIAKTAAKYHLIIDLHGIYKPTGLNRTYPNILGYEGVFGLENYRWYKDDMVTNELCIPFIRMVAGPVDYTPGGMNNATKDKYIPIANADPMVQGTRAHQVAFYPVYDAPFGILADSPVNYIREEETTNFISRIPTTFDKTEVLQGKIGEYIVTARQKGSQWYIGSLNAWEARDIELSLDFLDSDKTYTAEIFKDGVNADRFAMDYKLETKNVSATDHLTIHMAPGGGFAIILTAK